VRQAAVPSKAADRQQAGTGQQEPSRSARNRQQHPHKLSNAFGGSGPGAGIVCKFRCVRGKFIVF
jgi:hypothetical protein